MFKRHTTIFFLFVCSYWSFFFFFLLQYSISVRLLFTKRFWTVCQLTIISGLFGRLLRVFFDCIESTRARCCNKISINTNIYTQNEIFFFKTKFDLVFHFNNKTLSGLVLIVSQQSAICLNCFLIVVQIRARPQPPVFISNSFRTKYTCLQTKKKID